VEGRGNRQRHGAGAEGSAEQQQPGQEEVVDAEFSEVDEGENKG
jgi:hypothetical protein